MNNEEAKILDRATYLELAERVGRLGHEIYERKFREEFEKNYHGKYVAIDVDTEQAFIGDTSEGASKNARQVNPKAIPLILGVGFDASIRLPYRAMYPPH